MFLKSESYLNMNVFYRIVLLFFFINISLIPLSAAEPSVTDNEDNDKEMSPAPKENVTNLENKDLQAFCNDWYGTKYQYGGCSRSGIDCSCFARTLYKTVYRIDLERSSAIQYKQTRRVKRINKLE